MKECKLCIKEKITCKENPEARGRIVITAKMEFKSWNEIAQCAKRISLLARKKR